MIKNSAYIRDFSPETKALLEQLSAELKMKNASDIFLYALEQFRDNKNEIARLKRLIEYKQKKINALTGNNDEQ